MCNVTEIKRFIAYAKICSSKIAYKYVNYSNNGKDTEDIMLKLRLIRSYIRSVESYIGMPKKSYRNGCCETICVRTCLNSEEICNIVNRIKSICKTC